MRAALRLLALILLAVTPGARGQAAEPDLGVGFVVVSPWDVARSGDLLVFYRELDAPEPAFLVRIDTFRSSSDPLVQATLVRDGAEVPWPEGKLLSEFGILHLPAFAEANGRVRTEVEGEPAWLAVQPGADFVPWGDYLVTYVTGFDRMDPSGNPLRTAPDADAVEVPFSPPDGEGWECLAVREVRGEWARVEWSELCWREDLPPVDGWIRWRDGKRLLIDYGLVC